MSDQKNRVENNIKRSHEASAASRFLQDGPTNKNSKLSSKNFESLMKQRGITGEKAQELKESMKNMTVRHGKAGESFVTTHGIERSSGIFVSESSLGNTPDERIDKGALPHSNTADFETKVRLSQDQNLIYGEIISQKKFSRMDPKQKPRNGGATQVVTDGGYSSGAIINQDPKFPIPVNPKTQNQYLLKKDRSTDISSAHKSINRKNRNSR